jgi:threonine/homoserine/homoserine lactone efflux protein
MGDLLVELIPFALGMAITPSAIAVGILFLGSKRPVGNALAFAAAFALVYIGLAALVIGASAAATEPLFSDEDKSVAALVVGLVLLALGAFTLWRHRRSGGPPERSRLLTEVDEASPFEAFGIGLVLAVLNPNVPILLGGLAACVAADVSDAARTAGAAFLVAASLLLLVGPVVWYLVDRKQAERGLARLKDWLARHQTAVNLAVLFGFGALFAVKGLSGL